MDIDIISIKFIIMKQFFLCAVIAASVSGSAFAQNLKVNPFEFEVGAGMSIGSKYGLDKAVPGPNSYMEARLNLFDTPWDLGVQTSLGAAFRKQNDQLYNATNKFGITVFTDYNFRNKGMVSPFIGLGVGRTAIVNSYPAFGADGTAVTAKSAQPAFVLNPRMGLELFDHLRLSVEYKFTFQKESSYMALNLGYTFGGGRMK